MYDAMSSGVALQALTVGNDGHVPNVLRIVHETTDLEPLSVCHSTACRQPLWPDGVRGAAAAAAAAATWAQARYVPPRP